MPAGPGTQGKAGTKQAAAGSQNWAPKQGRRRGTASWPSAVAGLRVKYPFPLVSCLPTSRAWGGQPRSHLTFYVSSGLSWLVAAAAALAASTVVGHVVGDAVAALRLAILCVHALTLR
jgi:hypothetical protein